MFRYVFVLLVLMLDGFAYAHQLTPTYPVFELSFVEGVSYAKLEIFNKRKEVEYYEIGVFTGDWRPVPFASENAVIQINYLETKRINVYVRDKDVKKVVYICTESRLKKEMTQYALISSKVCSKIKHENN